MALDAVVSVIYQKLRDVVAEESITRNKVIGTQLKEMQEALEKMQGFFIDAADKEKETNVEAIKKWTDEYLKNLYSVEDTIESFALRITRQRKRMGFLMNHALFLKNFTACKKLSRKLKKIQRKIDGLYDQKPKDVVNASLRSNRSLQNYKQIDSSTAVNLSTYDNADDSISTSSITKGSSPKRRSFSGVTTNTHVYSDHSIISTSSITKGSSPRRRSFSGVTKFSRENSVIRERFKQEKLKYNSFSDGQELYIVGFGFELDLHYLVKRLTNGDDRIISLVGELGSGKTTLARAVYGNRKIKEHFKSLCWITISKDSSAEDYLRNILKQVGESGEQDGGRLKDRKYLIVLDGVGSFEVWENLKNAFPDQKNGSKIILTATQDSSKSHTHYMKKLDDQDSWELFLHKVDLKESDRRWTLRKKIIQICNGLPLNIVLLGSLLSTKKMKAMKNGLQYLTDKRTGVPQTSCHCATTIWMPTQNSVCFI